MRFLKNRFIGCACAAAFALLAAACLKPVKAVEDKDDIVVWEQEDAAVAPFIDSVFADFKKLPGNEKVAVTRVHYQNEDLRQQFQTASIAETGPDLIMCPSDFGGVFSVAGFILPVDGLFELGKYNTAVLDAVRLDGHTWGVPISNGNHLMLMYNKKFLHRAPENTDEMLAFCATAKARGLDYCMAMDMGEPFWLVPWLGGFGGWPIDGHRPTLDTKAMRATIDFYLDLKFGKKYVPEECDYNCIDGMFKEGRVAMIVNGDWALQSYQARFGQDFGTGKIPRNSATGLWPAPMISGKYFMLNAALAGKKEKLEKIKELVEFYTSRDNQIRQIEVLKRLPALKAANDAPQIKANPVLAGSMEQILAGKPMPLATEMRAVWDAMRPYQGKIMTKKETPRSGLEKMQLDADSKIKEMNR
ncbi:MAG: extracellular solute-binding protein [Elusimicrobiaceae bacterium]|nr:extracellular solute-binding protein [Elusimicrobiaceae bacterium]